MSSQEQQMSETQSKVRKLWLPTNPEIKEVMKKFNKEETEFKLHAMYYLLHHFRPQMDAQNRIRYRYIMIYQTKCLLQIDDKFYLSFLEQHGVLENANVSGFYFRLKQPYTTGDYFPVPLDAKYERRLKTFEKIPTKFIEEAELVNWRRGAPINVDYRF